MTTPAHASIRIRSPVLVYVWQTVERAIKTVAQSGAAYVTAIGASPAGFDPRVMLFTMVGSGIASVFTSVASAKIGPSGTPSMVSTSGEDNGS